MFNDLINNIPWGTNSTENMVALTLAILMLWNKIDKKIKNYEILDEK